MESNKRRKSHKIYHKTNPNSLPNPFNWEPRIRLLDQAGEFIEMVSQIAAFRLLKADAADLLLVQEPTVQLKIPTEQWVGCAKGAPQRTQAKWHNWLHARRTILYGNYNILSPEGDLMFHCNNQKALWYLNRDLVEIVAHDPPTLKLKFLPGGPGHVGDAYYLTPKINRCVVCGCTQGLNRHHVVPSFYRRYMGLEIKSHSYHDVLLMCLDCHEKYEDEAGKLKQIIAKEFEVPLHGFWHRETGREYAENKEALSAIKAAIALKEFGDRIPPKRQEELKERIAEYLKRPPTQQEMDDLAGRSTRSRVPGHGHCPKRLLGYIDHGEMVVRKLGSMEAIQAFTERWRQHFLQSMQPKYLPANWDFSKPLLPEDYEPEQGGVSLVHERTYEQRGPTNGNGEAPS